MRALGAGLLFAAILAAGCGDEVSGTTGSTGGVGGHGGDGTGGQAQGSTTTGEGGAGGAVTGTGGSGTGGMASDVGQPCESDADCVADCILNYPGGYCTLRDCSMDPEGEPQCPEGSICRGGGGIGSYACFDECLTTDDCRPGYECCSADGLGGALVCAPNGFLCA